MHHGDGPKDPTVAHLPLTDPRCNTDSCTAFEAAHNASQAQVSYYWQFEYGHWTTWYYLIFIFLFMLPFLYHQWKDSRPQRPVSQTPSFLNKAVAAGRMVSYRRYSGQIADTLGMPSAGLQLFFLAAIIFATVATFAVRPYYRGHRGYGSPPLAIRTGLMAIALTPIIVALSGKVNLVTMLTGIGYEKLNVVHRWLAWICVALSVAHTVPFIVAPLRDGGAAALRAQYYKPEGYEYTGTPPLAVLVFLSAFSIPYIRSKAYELFAYSHVFAAIAYLGLMFWHAGQAVDSWVYLWATVAIWVFSILGRIFYKNSALSIKRPWLEGFPTTVNHLPDNIVKLEILVPSNFVWRPCQHCFLRFPGLSLFDNHPFTIASAPEVSGTGEKQSEVNTLVFLIRAHDGFTRKLLTHARSGVDLTLNTFIDGPYGGLSRKIEAAYDSVILVAGGGGITASLSWLIHLSKHLRSGNAAIKQLTLVWVVRKKAHLNWITEELSAAQAIVPQGTIAYEFYVTDESSSRDRSSSDVSGQQDEKQVTRIAKQALSSPATSSHPSLSITSDVYLHRPDLGERVSRLLREPRTCVLGCGPESMKIDLSNAVARAQRRVLSNELREVALHTETFGW
ncbi:MAG: hypothetical protein M1837_005353 [Sclerophora amabilis]|nr:MAG: hypothetical protein M1837_005353 [Sclerophora amabilis]